MFNPLSVYFCHRRDGGLAAILYEVCNTYSERHTYVMPVRDDGRAVVRQSCAKRLYVSPFTAMDSTYRFRILPPGEDISVVIRQEDADGLLLAACFRARRNALTEAALAASLARFPLMTLKVTAAIHWEALRLWLKGLRVFPHRAAGAAVSSSSEPVDLPLAR